MSEELFKDIEGFDNYQISTYGQVRSKRNKILLTQKPNSNGYLRVGLYTNKKQKFITTSSLVLSAFIGKRPSKHHDAAHLDGNVKNNNLENLQWKTKRENALDKIRHGTLAKGDRHGKTKLKKEDINYILDNYVRKNKKRSNIPVLAKMFSVSIYCIKSALLAKTTLSQEVYAAREAINQVTKLMGG